MRILIFGTFDRLHPGHEFVIREAQKRGDVTIIIARDANVLRIKGHSPDQSEQERKAGIESAFPNVQVLLGDEKDFLKPVRELQPNLILLGYDQKLPPGVSEKDLPCVIERLLPFRPDEFKSSKRRSL